MPAKFPIHRPVEEEEVAGGRDLMETGGTLCVEIYEERVLKRLPPELARTGGTIESLAVAFD